MIFLPCEIAVETNQPSPPSVPSCWAIHLPERPLEPPALSRHQLERLCAVAFAAISAWGCSPAKRIWVSLMKPLASGGGCETLLAGDGLRLLLWARSGGEAEDDKVLHVYGLWWFRQQEQRCCDRAGHCDASCGTSRPWCHRTRW